MSDGTRNRRDRGDLSAAASAQLAALSGWGVLLVAAVHGTTLDSAAARSAGGALGAVAAGQAAVAFGAGRVAVPFFFVASGLLFFLRLHAFSQLRGKLRRRVGSLLVPYLAWSGLWLAAYAIAVRAPATASLAARLHAPAPDAPAAAWLRAWLLDPAAGHLWFVRDLLVLNLLAPALWAAFRLCGRAGWVLPAAAAAAWVALPDPAPISLRPWWGAVSLVGLTGFLFGGWLAGDAARLDRRRPAGFAAAAVFMVWAALVGVRLFAGPWGPGANRALDCAGIAAGLAAFWACGPAAARLSAGAPGAVSRHSFFCYAAHFPAVAVAALLVVRVGGGTPAAHAAAFLFAPPAVILAVAGVAAALARFAPALLGVLSGGRGVARVRPPAPDPSPDDGPAP